MISSTHPRHHGSPAPRRSNALPGIVRSEFAGSKDAGIYQEYAFPDPDSRHTYFSPFIRHSLVLGVTQAGITVDGRDKGMSSAYY